MGCTSSAPNTIPLNTSTADKSIQFEEETNENPSIEVDVADTEDENRTNETKVLPSCDSQQPVQLARNNKSMNSLSLQNDAPANGHVIESEEVVETPAITQEEVKIPKLELLMDKVFETNHHLNGDHKDDMVKKDEENSPIESKEAEPETAAKDNEDTETNAEAESKDNDGNEVENNTEEVDDETEASPSQSQSSRATRWEALADIAAELPPSLAVDPITGQIYQIALPK